MTKQLNNVRHDYLRYANCWEDADLLLKGLDIQAGDRVLSIASAGDNSFSLLSKSPELVVAMDINPVQLALTDLKRAAFKVLDHAQFLNLLGFENEMDRWSLFLKLEDVMNDTYFQYWKDRKEELVAGLIYRGKFERYFSYFRKYMLPLIHSSGRIDRLFEPKSSLEQEQFYNKIWNNKRWDALFRIFFSRKLMGMLGRDPAFLKEVELPVSEFILGKAKAHLSAEEAQDNYFLNFIMKGEFGSRLPHYARKESFDLIKANIDSLRIEEGLVGLGLHKYAGFNKFNLSNIFEYMPEDLFRREASLFAERTEPGAVFAYWNLMVPRKLADLEAFTTQEVADLPTDMGFFYEGFNINKRL